MNGPAAPKDPEKKRPYFYIMKDKEIFGAKSTTFLLLLDFFWDYAFLVI